MYVVVYCKEGISEARCVVKNVTSVSTYMNAKVELRTRDTKNKCGNEEALRLDQSLKRFQGFDFKDVVEIHVEED